MPAAALFSRYDELYGKTVSAYAYMYYENGSEAVLAPDELSPGRGDHYSCIFVSLDDAKYSGAFKRDEIKTGMYYVRVTGLLVDDSKQRGVCVGTFASADLFITWRLSGYDDQNR